MKYLHWRGIAELSFARAAASYAYFDAKRRLNRFDPYFLFCPKRLLATQSLEQVVESRIVADTIQEWIGDRSRQ